MQGQKNIKNTLEHCYKTSPMVSIVDSFKLEKTVYGNIMQNATMTKATLITCTKTGQPIGQLFNNCVDEYVDASICPRWVCISKDKLKQHYRKQPIATAAYLIRLLIADKTLAQWLRLTNHDNDTITSIQFQVDMMKDLYALLQSAEHHSTIGKVISYCTTYIDFENNPKKRGVTGIKIIEQLKTVKTTEEFSDIVLSSISKALADETNISKNTTDHDVVIAVINRRKSAKMSQTIPAGVGNMLPSTRKILKKQQTLDKHRRSAKVRNELHSIFKDIKL